MRSLLVTAGAIVVLGASAPGLITRYLEQTSAPGRTEAARQGDPLARVQNLSNRQVEIPAESDGHYYVGAEINFQAVRLMVDTGASVVALRQSDAEAAGIRVRPAEFDQPVSTANGTAYAASAELDSVSINDIEVSGVRALILPDDQLGISLLGGSFLNRLARFQVADGTLVLEN
jgi:aspartyl protease family protein